VFDALPSVAATRAEIADPAVPPQIARHSFMLAVQQHVGVFDLDPDVVAPMLRTVLTVSCDMLAFWLRPNALYEPTLPLGGLLGGIDISQDLPLQLLQPPGRTLCIVPPWQQRHHCANASAILVLSHDAAPEQAPAQRALTLIALWPNAAGLAANELLIPVKDESATLADALALAVNATRRNADSGISEVELDKLTSNWKQLLDYTVKVLLYLNLDDPVLHGSQAYTEAPKEFPGLGRRKRELKLAEVEQLYDRYIVGPRTAADWAGEHASEVGAHGQLSAHWRRGHFRLQAHGPQASLRKVMFIMPTIVRADRLNEPS
jgi:hypothetical protein